MSTQSPHSHECQAGAAPPTADGPTSGHLTQNCHESPVLVCFLGKTHPGPLVLMFIQPLLAVATKEAVA